MSGAFTAVDLSRLSAPPVIEALSFEAIRDAAVADFQARFPEFDTLLPTDPVFILLEVFAYREMIVRQRVNDAARAVMPAFAVGADLDHLAALFGVSRLQIAEADLDNDIPAAFESDDDLRRRLVLSPEGYSVAGPEGAYIFHALSADADVLDASATSPDPGEVVVTVLARSGDGTADSDLLSAVEARVSADDVRPLTDHVTVQSAEIIEFSVVAAITTFSGPDAAVVLAAAEESIEKYVAEAHRIGRDVTMSGLYGALHVAGVQGVAISSPTASIAVSATQASWCTGITLTHAGIGA